MPQRIKRPCKYPSCPELTHERFCDKHKKQVLQQADRERGTAAERGYDARWRRYRSWYLKQHPLCKHCQEQENKLTPATVVDHIIPHKRDMVWFWDENNHQPLCKQHHDRKTVKEDGGFGKSYL